MHGLTVDDSDSGNDVDPVCVNDEYVVKPQGLRDFQLFFVLSLV